MNDSAGGDRGDGGDDDCAVGDNCIDYYVHNDDSVVSGAEGDSAGVIRELKQPRRQRQRNPLSVRVFHKTRNW